MKTNLRFIGIDVSKDTLDIGIYSEQDKSTVIKNNKKAILKYFNFLLSDEFEYHICIENTGKYSWSLMELLPDLDCYFYVVNPLHLKRSLGLVRGKNDKIDALRIAEFIKKNYEEITPYISQRNEINLLQILLSERRFKVKQRKQLKTKNKENSVLSAIKIAKKLTLKNNKLIKELSKQIIELEKEIKHLISNDESLNKLNKQLKSVPGVGDILCWNILVKTNEFKTIKDPRKLACYAGVAPFANTSGISVFGRNRVSNYADKGLKKILHLGALSAIRLENDLAFYYNRKVEEGKNKMSVLNAVRNKIIHIIFALIKNQDFYQNRLVMS
jgi:transposase